MPGIGALGRLRAALREALSQWPCLLAICLPVVSLVALMAYLRVSVPMDGLTAITQPTLPWAGLCQVLTIGSLTLVGCVLARRYAQRMQRLHERNAEIQRTLATLQQAQAHSEEFLAAVGHELRTPMNAILGFNSALHQELADRPDQVVQLDHIRRATDHVLQVVNDILDFSQLQAGKLMLHLEDFELQALMNEALQVDRDKASEKGLLWRGRLDPALPTCVRADRQRILQILRKLLSNALEFTAQGEVTLRIHAEHGRLNFSVHDTGCGMAQDRQAHIFRRFEHVEMQATRMDRGTGLGLAICQKLVELQGGQIGVRSQPGHGATFWFHVPLVPAPTATVRAQHDDVLSADEALQILVVDDNAMNLMVARLQIQKCWPRADIVTLGSAAQALELLDTRGFDVALVDMLMPEMDGMALTRQIRQRFPQITARMPIIALTANTHSEDRQHCRDAGMDDVLAKPMNLQALVRCVSHHVLKARG